MSSPPDLASLEDPAPEREDANGGDVGTGREHVGAPVATSKGKESTDGAERPKPFMLVRGSSAIKVYQGDLERLAERCGQSGTMVHLPYFLLPCRLGAKVPHLLIRTDPEGELDCAVLLNQYMVGGIPTGLFIPNDLTGPHSVLAPAGMRSAIAEEATAFLLRGMGLVVLLSLQDGDFSGLHERRLGRFQWTTQRRTMVQTLPLAETLEATLATLGSHTRRNLRYYRRRVVAELGATFEPFVKLARPELIAMTRYTLYPVPGEVVDCRLHAVGAVAGSFAIGLRGSDGEWLSLLGGRRYDGVTTVDWQMNTDKLHPTFSLATAMRAFLLEDEIARGTRCLSFDGGTSHPMHRSFVPETMGDLLLARWFLPRRWLRRFVPPRLPPGIVLSKMLESTELVWRFSRG